MKAIVTGGAGFIGSNLVDALAGRGDEVMVIDDLSTGHRENLAHLDPPTVELRVADIADAGALAAAVGGFDVDVVFHLAAQADVRKALADPVFDARINVIGTINALELARRAGAAVVFAATGGAVYGEGDGRDLPLDESATAEPETAYGVSKLAGEHYVGLYRRIHSVPGVSLRFANVYGPRQDPHGEAGVVAILCGRLLAGEPATVFGDGLQTRDYVYVGDTVGAIVVAGDRMRAPGGGPGGPLNIGTGVETTVLTLVERLGAISGEDFRAELAPARTGEVRRIALDCGRAEAELGWRATTALDAGLASTLESVREGG